MGGKRPPEAVMPLCPLPPTMRSDEWVLCGWVFVFFPHLFVLVNYLCVYNMYLLVHKAGTESVLTALTWLRNCIIATYYYCYY